MPHAYWSGFLRLSLVSCPIYLSPATSERERISLHQINPKTGNRIRLQPVDAETGEELDRGDLIRGYEVEKGQYIEITKDELASLKRASSSARASTYSISIRRITFIPRTPRPRKPIK